MQRAHDGAEGDLFSDPHPLVYLIIHQVVVAQQERDDKFRELIKITLDVFCFLNQLKVASLEGHRQTIKLLTLQTTECAYFIRDYTKQKRSFSKRSSYALSTSAYREQQSFALQRTRSPAMR